MGRLSLATKFYREIMTRKPVDGAVIPNYMDFNEIDWKSLTGIGAGAYGSVLRNKMYAVKVGVVRDYQVERLYSLFKGGFGIPVYGYWQSVFIPDFVLDKWVPNSKVRNYTNNGKADVMVMALAKPAVKQRGLKWADYYDGEEFKQVEKAAEALRYEIDKNGLRWFDDHVGNFGYWQGKAVVLDA